MPMTMVRLNMVKGLGPMLQIAEGWSCDIDPEAAKIIWERTDPTWPTTWFAPRIDESNPAFKDVYSVMANWGANHCSLCYGHVGADLITLASMLRIPVACTTLPMKRSSVRVHGAHSAPRISKAPTTAPAPTSARSTSRSEFNLTKTQKCPRPFYVRAGT